MIKNTIRKILNCCGIYAKWYRNIPYGIDWMQDIDRISQVDWQPKVVFDVGANIGQTTLDIADHWDGCDIHAFEPVKSTFKTLTANAAHLPRAHCHHCGLGETEGRLTMRALANNVMNSLKSDRMANVAEAADEEVTIATVDKFSEAHEIRSIDVLKTDTEGFDVEVLRGASRMLEESAISFVFSEVTFLTFERQSGFADVHTLLREYGFVVVGFYDTGSLVPTDTDSYCNALFAHRSALRKSG